MSFDNPTDPTDRMLAAARFACIKHMGQKRADGITPYFAHLTRVALVLSSEFGVRDPNLLAAAMLHDVLEDTNTDYEEIANEYGTEIADTVVALTKNALLPKKERERDYLQRLLAAPERVRIVKLADMFDNLTSRRGSPRLERTVENLRPLLEGFRGTFATREGVAALARVTVLHTSCAGEITV